MPKIEMDITSTNQGAPRDVMLVAVVNPDGTPVAGGGGGLSEALLSEMRDQNNEIINLLTEIRANTAPP